MANSLFEEYHLTGEMTLSLRQPSKCDLLYALLWLDPRIPETDDTMTEGTPPNRRIDSHQVHGIGSRTSGAMTNRSLEVPQREMDGARELHFDTESNSVGSRPNTINHRNRDRVLGEAEPEQCPAELQMSSGSVCRKPSSHGAYCSVHAKLFPPLRSSEKRFLKHVQTSLQKLCRMHGYQEFIHGGDLSDILRELSELANNNQPPWDDISSSFLPQTNSQESSGMIINDIASSNESCDAGDVRLVSANLGGSRYRPSEVDKSNYIKSILHHKEPGILFLQEMNLKSLTNQIEKGRFFQETDQDPRLSHYNLVKSSAKPDVCLLYNKKYYNCVEAPVDLTDFFDRKYIGERNLRSGMKRTAPFSSRYVGAILESLDKQVKFLCMSYHGPKNSEKLRAENCNNAEEALEACVRAVNGYVQKENISAVIGGDFNVQQKGAKELCTEWIGNLDAFQIETNLSSKSIDYYLIIHSQKSQQQQQQQQEEDKDKDELVLDSDPDDDISLSSDTFDHKPALSRLVRIKSD